LYAYQPRDGVSPGEWSGEMLTASARYSNPAHPMAQATAADSTLADFVDAYPPQWNGFVQLRIYLGAPDQPIFSATYAATDLQISGDTWTVVRGGSVPCNSGTAVSLEDLVTPTTPPTTGPGAPATSEVVASTTIATADPSATTTPLAASESAASTSASSGSSGPSTGLVIAVVVVVLVAIAVSLVWLRRRRSVRPT